MYEIFSRRIKKTFSIEFLKGACTLQWVYAYGIENFKARLGQCLSLGKAEKQNPKTLPIFVVNFIPVYLKHFIEAEPQAKQLA